MSSKDVVRLILAHLAASGALGCENRAEHAQPAVPATASVTPVSPAPPIASVAPSATATPVPLPTASATAKPPSSCRVGTTDCGPGFVCAAPTDGTRILPGPGNCWPAGRPIPGGRPLVVEGETHVAKTRGGDARDPVQARLLRAAVDEHASVAAFARTICQLMALGAPAALVMRTGRALNDEIVHARLAFETLSACGVDAEAEALPEAISPFAGTESREALVESLLIDTFRGGCIGETLAAHEASVFAEAAPDARVRGFYAKIAADEARHAALAYETVLWLVEAYPPAAAVLTRERVRFAAEASQAQQTLLAPLLAVLERDAAACDEPPEPEAATTKGWM